MPAETDHPVFEAPKDFNVKIWRYMDFTKFVSLIDTNKLFFARSDLLGDPYEGSTSHFNKDSRSSVYKDLIPPEILENTPEILENMSAFNDQQRQWTFINCWHMNEVESSAMWKVYTQTSEAVAIQSTYQILQNLLPEETYIGVVKYIDYETGWFPESNSMYPYVHKRKSFSYERELRAVIYDMPSNFSEYLGSPDDGRFVPIDVQNLVQRVYIAPTSPSWFRSLVKNVLSKYDLSIRVVESALDKPPTF